MAIHRTRVRSQCAVCGELPQESANGRLKCSCGTLWLRCLGKRGTEEEETALGECGFQRAVDCQGDVYYVMPEGGHIIHFYDDGTWDSDKAAPNLSLEEYLAWAKPLRDAVATI